MSSLFYLFDYTCKVKTLQTGWQALLGGSWKRLSSLFQAYFLSSFQCTHSFTHSLTHGIFLAYFHIPGTWYRSVTKRHVFPFVALIIIIITRQIIKLYPFGWASQVVLVVQNLTANTGDIRDAGSITGSWISPWRRAWQPTPVFLPGESHGQRSLVGYSPRSHKGSDTTEVT